MYFFKKPKKTRHRHSISISWKNYLNTSFESFCMYNFLSFIHLFYTWNLIRNQILFKTKITSKTRKLKSSKPVEDKNKSPKKTDCPELSECFSTRYTKCENRIFYNLSSEMLTFFLFNTSFTTALLVSIHSFLDYFVTNTSYST